MSKKDIKKMLKLHDLSVSKDFYNFVNKELLPNKNFKRSFLAGFNKSIHDLAKKIKNLLIPEKKYKNQLIYHLEKKEKK